MAGSEANLDYYEYVNINMVVNTTIAPFLNSPNFKITFEVQNKYVDLDDFDSPVKFYFTSYTLGEDSTDDYTVERNEIELQDSWWDIFSPPEEIELNNIKSQFDRRRDTTAAIVENNLVFELGEEIQQYRRQNTNFLGKLKVDLGIKTRYF